MLTDAPRTAVAGRCGLAAAAAAALLASIGLQLRATGAVPGTEFQAAGVLYEALPWLVLVGRLLAAATAALLVIELLRVHRRPPDRLLLALGSATAAAAPWIPEATGLLIIAAVGAVWLRDRSDLRRALRAARGPGAECVDTLGRSLGAPRASDLLRFGAVLGTLAFAGALAVTQVESYVYTRRFAPELFPADALLPYRFRLCELACHFGFGLGLAYLAPVLVVRAVARRRPRTALLLLSAIVAGTMTLYMGAAAAVHVGSEILKTGVLPEAAACLVLLFVWWCHLAHAVFATGGYTVPGGLPPTPGRVFAVAALAPLLAPPRWFGRRLSGWLLHRRGAWFVVCAAAAGAWFALLVWSSYPELEDFRSEFIVVGVITAVHVVVLGLLALVLAAPRVPLRHPPRHAVLGAALGACVLLVMGLRPLRGDPALILNEYTRFGYVVKKASFRELLLGSDPLGETPRRTPFPFHGAGEGRYPKAPPRRLDGRRPPVVFILWDAARPDRMGCYGHFRDTTPHADRFAQDAVVFERAYSMATATTCGVRHIMTGRYSTRYMLADDHPPFFVHGLRRHGYDRFLITAFGSDFNGVSLESFLRQGPAPEADGAWFANLTRHPHVRERELPDRVKTGNLIDAWREVHAERGSLDGTFSWIHLTGTHFPWWNRNPVKDFGHDNRALYDGELAKVDALTGKALDALQELGAYDGAIIVLLADHGTGLMEHGRWGGFLPYEEQIRIPLLVKMPGVPSRRVPAPVTTIDLAPTLLGVFEPGARNAYDGVSLLPLMTGGADRLERRWFVSLCSFEDAYALIEDGRWKLHYHRSERYALLFDLEDDPLERKNLLEERPQVARRLVDRLDAWLWEGRDTYAHPHHFWP